MPGGNTSSCTRATVEAVTRKPPTTCWKNAATPRRASTRPIRSMIAVVTNAVVAVSGPPPSSRAIDAASAAQPNVATQRG